MRNLSTSPPLADHPKTDGDPRKGKFEYVAGVSLGDSLMEGGRLGWREKP